MGLIFGCTRAQSIRRASEEGPGDGEGGDGEPSVPELRTQVRVLLAQLAAAQTRALELGPTRIRAEVAEAELSELKVGP